MKKKNLAEAKKQVIAERNSAEVEAAKNEYRSITDNIDRLDREIKVREDAKKEYEKALEVFGK